MTRQRATMRAVALRVAVLAVMSTTLLGVAANPASADWYFSDGLESSTSGNWAIGGSGFDADSHLYTMDCGLALTGCGGAIIQQIGPGFMSVGRSLHIGAARGDLCYLIGNLQRRIYGTNRLQVNVEVIEPTTWRYLAVRTVTLHGPGSGIWEEGFTAFMLDKVRDVFIRFSVLGDSAGSRNMVNVDDVSVWCITGSI